jgi:hypothetical protein
MDRAIVDWGHRAKDQHRIRVRIEGGHREEWEEVGEWDWGERLWEEMRVVRIILNNF